MEPSEETTLKLKSIEGYGRRYVKDFLGDQIANRDRYRKDWFEALKFLLRKSFMRGRRDDLSVRFREAAFEALDEARPSNGYDAAKLETLLAARGVNNRGDRKMVIGVLDFAFNSLGAFEHNIVEFTLRDIHSGKLNEVYKSLDGIFEIGDKIACFFLRDVVLIYELQGLLKEADFRFCQPVDTWVMQAAQKLGIVDTAQTERERAKDAIIRACLSARVSPLLFNAGAWLTGAKSYDLLFEKL